MGKHQRFIEKLIHGIFLLLGLVTVGCVLLITVVSSEGATPPTVRARTLSSRLAREA